MTIIIGCTNEKITGTAWEDNKFKYAIKDSDIRKYVGSDNEITNLLSQGYELNIDKSGIGIIARIGKTKIIGCCYKPEEIIFESIYEAEGCSLKETISTLNKMINAGQKKEPPKQYTKSYFGHELSRKTGN